MRESESNEYASAVSNLEDRARRREHRAFTLRAIFILLAGLTSAGMIGVGGYLALRPAELEPNMSLIVLFVGAGVFLLIFAGMVALLRFGSEEQKSMSDYS